MENQKSLSIIRKDIQTTIYEEIGKHVTLSERASICFEQFYYDKDFYSWQLKLLKSIFDTTPAVFNQLVNIDPCFKNFDYKKLRKVIRSTWYWKYAQRSKSNKDKSLILPSSPEAIFREYAQRSEINKEKKFSAIVHHLFSDPDPGEIAVLYLPSEPPPKKELIKKIITVDDLVLLLFWTLFAGEYVSDLAVSLLHMAGKPIHMGSENRWYLETLQGIVTNVEELDASYSSQQWILYHDGYNYKIKPFGVWSVNQLDESPLKDGSLWIARGNIIQPPSRFREDAINELEYLINRNALEKDFQDFFERNPEFLLTLGDYKGIHSQLVLHEDSSEALIPDFFLEKINSNFCDIVDLKRANIELARHQRYRKRFRDAVMEGIAQLEYYRNWFEDKRNLQEFYSRYGLKAYRPKIVLIIGRRQNFYEEVELIQTKGLLPSHSELRTYDDIVDLARHYLKIISG